MRPSWVALTAVLAVAGFLPGLLSARQSGPLPAPGPFHEVAAAAGVSFRHTNGASPDKHLIETMGSGGLFLDFDGDGWLDIFLVDGGSVVDPAVAARARHRLYRNLGDGTFVDVTEASGIAHRGYGMGACAADYDNDGRIDLYITGLGANALYRNNGNGTWTDTTSAAGLGTTRLTTSCAFVDVDHDGFVDLYVVGYVDVQSNPQPCVTGRVRVYCRPDVYAGVPDILYRNNGDGTFTDISQRAGIHRADGKGLGVVAGDYDDDGLVDVFVANDLTPNLLYRNEGGGTFRETALLAGVAVASDARVRAGMGTDFGDYTGDGRLDLVVTNFELEMHTLFKNLGKGLFGDATFESGIGPATNPYLGFGAVFLDVDNDGDLDLAIANGHVLDNASLFRASSTHAQRNLLLVNDGAGRLREAGMSAGPAFAIERVSRALVAGDIDNDGDLDLLVTNNGQAVQLLRNDGARGQHAILVNLIGRESNRNGIGARIRATAGGRTQVREVKAGSSYLGQNDLRVHIGLGANTRVDQLEIRWPSGRIEVIAGVDAQQIVTVTEGLGITARVPFARR